MAFSGSIRTSCGAVRNLDQLPAPEIYRSLHLQARCFGNGSHPPTFRSLCNSKGINAAIVIVGNRELS